MGELVTKVAQINVSRTVEANRAAWKRGFMPIRQRMALALRSLAEINRAGGADPDQVERLGANATRQELLYRLALRAEQEKPDKS